MTITRIRKTNISIILTRTRTRTIARPSIIITIRRTITITTQQH